MRRLLREEGIIPAQRNLSRDRVMPIVPEAKWWKGPLVKVGAALGVGASLIAYLPVRPHMVIQKDFVEDQTNPYSESFYIENEGWLSASSVRTTCKADTGFSGGPLSGSVFNVDAAGPALATLAHGKRASLPCDQLFSGHNLGFEGSKLSVQIAYDISITPFSRSQVFEFTSVRGYDGRYEWRYK